LLCVGYSPKGATSFRDRGS